MYMCTSVLMYREQTNQSVYTFTCSQFFYFSSVMFWTKHHDLILCLEVLNLNPFTPKKAQHNEVQFGIKWLQH